MREELLFAWRCGYDAAARGDANHFERPDLREAWEQGNLRGRGGGRLEAKPMTQRAIAKELGISQGRVLALEQRAMQKMQIAAGVIPPRRGKA